MTDEKNRDTILVVANRTCECPARGQIGDAEPLHAIEDALVDFEAEEIMLSTHPPGQSHWLENGLLERARERFDAPVTHLVSGFGLQETGS